MKIKGKTKIELFDKDGNVKIQEDNNMVTNAIYQFYKTARTIPTNSSDVTDKLLSTIAVEANGLENFLNKDRVGIMLYHDTIPENPNIFYSSQIPFASAGSNYKAMTDWRGNLNTKESGNIKNKKDEIIGYKWVWDFGTHQANGQISCLSLTDRNRGDNFNSALFYRCFGVPEIYYYCNDGFAIPKDSTNRPLKKSFSDDGKLYISTDTGYEIYDGSKVKISYYSADLNNEGVTEIINFNTHSDFLKIISDTVNNRMFTIATNNDTGMKELLVLKKDTNEIIYSKELTNLTDTICDFGINGDDIIYTKTRNCTGGGDRQAYFYSLTDETISSATISANTYDFRSLCNINTMLTQEGDYLSCYSIVESLNYSYDYGSINVYIFNKDRTRREYKNKDNRDIYSPAINFGTSGITVAREQGCIYDTANESRATIGFVPGVLYTINNLQNPIEKTEANTMKITYEIRWAE